MAITTARPLPPAITPGVYVECHNPNDIELWGEEFEVMQSYAPLEHFDPKHPEEFWTCKAIRVRCTWDNRQYVAPLSWFHVATVQHKPGYER